MLQQYLFFLLLVTLSTLAFHIPIHILCSLHTHLPSPLRTRYSYLVPFFPRAAPLSTALLVSSCTKLFPILLIIWDYDLRSSATAVSWAVIVNNIAALGILLDCGYVRAGVLVGVGAAVRAGVAWGVLWGAGLGNGWEGYGGPLDEVKGWIEGWV